MHRNMTASEKQMQADGPADPDLREIRASQIKKQEMQTQKDPDRPNMKAPGVLRSKEERERGSKNRQKKSKVKQDKPEEKIHR